MNLKQAVENIGKNEIKDNAKLWVKHMVYFTKLDADVQGTIEDLRSREEAEDGMYQAWGGTIVSSALGSYTELSFLHDVLWEDEDFEDLQAQYNEDFSIREMIQSQAGLHDEVAEAIANELNRKSSLPGDYFIGHHEADGALGILYVESAE